jgi:hypothetical protein
MSKGVLGFGQVLFCQFLTIWSKTVFFFSGGATVQSVLYLLLVNGTVINKSNQTLYDYQQIINSLSNDIIVCNNGYLYSSQFRIITQQAVCKYSIPWYACSVKACFQIVKKLNF